MTMLTTRRMWRNKKYSRACYRGHTYSNGICINCGKVHRRKRARFTQQHQTTQTINEAMAQLEKNIRQTFEKEN